MESLFFPGDRLDEMDWASPGRLLPRNGRCEAWVSRARPENNGQLVLPREPTPYRSTFAILIRNQGVETPVFNKSTNL